MIRVAIREQLAGLILLASLIGLGVISVATWISNHNFVLGVVKSRLTLTASLKAAQLTSNLNLLQTTATLVSTRVIIQGALQQYNRDGNNSASNWQYARDDMVAIMDSERSPGQSLLLQSVIFPRNASGTAGHDALLNVTSRLAEDNIVLPLICPDGKQAVMGMPASECGGHSFGYPPALYPNLTFTTGMYNGHQVQLADYHGDIIGPGQKSALLLGPWRTNATLAMISITVPIVNNTSSHDVLGWLTVVMDGRLIEDVILSTEGLQDTGQTLIVGPVSRTNLFPNDILYKTNNGDPPKDFPVAYVVSLPPEDVNRHPDHVWGSANRPFDVEKYPAVKKALTQRTGHRDNSGVDIHSTNEAGKKVSVGFAMPRSSIIDWLIVVEQSRSEVWKPINRLRDILLACLFATVGFMVIVSFPLAHCAVLPIRRLREATARSVEPPGPSFSHSSFDSLESERPRGLEGEEGADGAEKENAPNGAVSKWRQKRHEEREHRRENRRRNHFRIPGKVKERKHLVKDELTDLTKTFNEMSDELMMQYSRLEERVQQRTAELEESKIAAEAANESKTLFIANISHELKTPLNGILGMCAVCMQEDDQVRLKRSLGIIYKSGDLLLNLLNDLLTFSKNQVGQQLTLDEKEFRLRDVSSQILAVFEQQAQEGGIHFRVQFEGVPIFTADDTPPDTTDYGPNGTGRLKDMVLWGDLQRILQVVINLVSNALKFTPSGGSVTLIVRCLPELATVSRNGSKASRQSPSAGSRSRQPSTRNHGSDATLPVPKIDTALAINVKDKPNAHVYGNDRAASPPPGVYLNFEFDVVDTGPGIAENLQQKIFEPFMQGDLGLSKKFGGTGLGLSICSQLASLMHGHMKVQSTLGSGSKFTMKIPLRHLKSRKDSSASSNAEKDGKQTVSRNSTDDVAKGTAARHGKHAGDESGDEKQSPGGGTASPSKTSPDMQPRLIGLSQPFFASAQPMEPTPKQSAVARKMSTAATQANGNGNKIRVLVAEDNKVNQEVVLRMLKLEDVYDVTVAKDGQEALDYVKESMGHETPGTPGGKKDSKPYDLIFMDVQMPNVDGLQSTRLIREIGYERPIVALTAYADENNVKNCLESGMNYFLSKPIRRPQLKKVLKEYCPPIPEENEEVTPPTEVTSSPTDGSPTDLSASKEVTPPTDVITSSAEDAKCTAKQSENAATKSLPEIRIPSGSPQNGQPKKSQLLEELSSPDSDIWSPTHA